MRTGRVFAALALSTGLASAPLATPVRAEPYLVADLGSAVVPQGSGPGPFAPVDGGLAFLTAGDRFERRLWVTDGSPDGTRQVLDLGGGDSFSVPEHVAAGGGKWLFSAGDRFWSTDGTVAGTVELGAIDPAYVATWAEELGLFLFTASRRTAGNGGIELWRSDGTAAGTRQVRDLTPGPASSTITSLISLDTAAFFLRRTSGGDQLWRSDGTASGTTRVYSALEIADPLAGLAGDVVFFGRDDSGWRFLRFDTESGEVIPLAALAPEPPSTFVGSPRQILGRVDDVLVLADDGEHGLQIWRSDGTSDGTRQLSSVAGGLSGDACFWGSQWVSSGSTAFRALGDGEAGCEVWRSDGTMAGTERVGDSCTGECDGDPVLLTPVAGGGVVFVARNAGFSFKLWSAGSLPGPAVEIRKACPSAASCTGIRGMALGDRAIIELETFDESVLWSTDGTPAGTARLVSTPDEHPDEKPPGAVVDGILVFAFDDGETGNEPWRTDGTPDGTTLLADIAAATTAGSRPFIRAAGKDSVLFSTLLEDPVQLWLSDGTAEGTRAIPPPPDSFHPDPWSVRLFATGAVVSYRDLGLWFWDGEETFKLADSDVLDDPDLATALEVGDRLHFVAQSGLWVTDGTAGGTARLTGPELAVERQEPALGALHGLVYFLAAGSGGNGLWRSDGTPEGTALVVEIPGFVPGAGGLFTRFGDRLGFVASTLEQGRELWWTDGTASGTQLVDLTPGPENGHPSQLVSVGPTLFFATGGFGFTNALWRTDGTPAGTVKLAAMSVDSIHAAGDLAFAVGSQAPTFQRGLYRSDGTAAGTFHLAELSFLRGPPATAGGLFFYFAHDGESFALWRSDGTAAGTYRVRGFAGDPHPEGVAAEGSPVGRRLLFSTSTSFGDVELWETDGTISGTRRLLSPPLRMDFGAGFHRAGPRVYFAADDGSHGVELWALPVEDVVAADPYALGLGAAARFEVELDWTDYAGHTGRAAKAPLRVDDSGLFWFFGEDNWELLVKVLDACSADGHYWVFASAATSVGYTLRVTDTATGEVRSYANPVGRPAPPIVDTAAFATCAAGLATGSAGAAFHPAAKTVPGCPSGVLCLGEGGRFHASMTWRRFDGQTGIGHPVPGTSESGLFWFFDDDNWEALVKVLDGCEITGHVWVFAAATTTVELTLRVEDTVTGEVAEYRNPLGQAASAITDTAALEVCP